MKTDRRYPPSPAGVRLTRQTLDELDRVAARTGRRRSDVIRAAVDAELERHRRRLSQSHRERAT